MGMGEVSVIIPTYNRGKSIVKSIQSVLDQSFPVREIIVVDDASADDTEEVVSSMKEEKVRYVRMEENGGSGAARNRGVREARSELVAFQDSDDEWYPTKIERQLKYMEEHPEFEMVYCAYEMELIPGYMHVTPEMGGEGLEGDLLATLLVVNRCGAPTMLMKKALFEEIGAFDESMRSIEDWDLAIRVARKGPIGFVPEVLMRVNRLGESVSTNYGEYFQNRCYMIKKYKDDYLSTGMLEPAIMNIFRSAEKQNALEQVKKMVMFHLAEIFGA